MKGEQVMKKKTIIGIFVGIMILCTSFFILTSDAVGKYFVEQWFISMGPDTSDWVLENDKYTVIPVLTEETVTFYVEDKDGNTLFTCEEIWRDWDFKRIDIDENNVITADSSDVGTYIYKEDGEGSFYLAEPIFDDEF